MSQSSNFYNIYYKISTLCCFDIPDSENIIMVVVVVIIVSSFSS